SRCKHTFELEAAATARKAEPAAMAAKPTPARQVRDEAELPLPFAAKAEPEKIASQPAPSAEPAASDPSSGEASESAEESWAISEPQRADEKPFVMPAPPPRSSKKIARRRILRSTTRFFAGSMPRGKIRRTCSRSRPTWSSALRSCLT